MSPNSSSGIPDPGVSGHLSQLEQKGPANSFCLGLVNVEASSGSVSFVYAGGKQNSSFCSKKI